MGDSRALKVPEIATFITDIVYYGEGKTLRTVVKLAQVNSYWLSIAMPLIWANMPPRSVSYILDVRDEQRRAAYASFVTRLTLRLEHLDSQQYNVPTFYRLTCLEIEPSPVNVEEAHPNNVDNIEQLIGPDLWYIQVECDVVLEKIADVMARKPVEFFRYDMECSVVAPTTMRGYIGLAKFISLNVCTKLTTSPTSFPTQISMDETSHERIIKLFRDVWTNSKLRVVSVIRYKDDQLLVNLTLLQLHNKALEAVTIRTPDKRPDLMTAFTNFTNLKQLVLVGQNYNQSADCMQTMPDMPQLDSLSATNMTHPESLANIARHAPNLTQLFLFMNCYTVTPLKSGHLAQLGGLTRLRKLWITFNEVNYQAGLDGFVAIGKGCRSLQEFTFTLFENSEGNDPPLDLNLMVDNDHEMYTTPLTLFPKLESFGPHVRFVARRCCCSALQKHFPLVSQDLCFCKNSRELVVV